MLIGVSGTLMAGRHEVIGYLERQGYVRLCVDSQRDQRGCESAQRDGLCFSTGDELRDYATKNWLRDFVVLLEDTRMLDILQGRPFFLHISVDAPVLVRWKRAEAHGQPVDLHTFLEQQDEQTFHRGGAELAADATLNLVNDHRDIRSLYIALNDLDLRDATRLRPSWDAYFMKLANLAAHRSNCMKRRVGCVLVRDKRVVATGYNGTPRGIQNCNEGGCRRCNQGIGAGELLSTCLCLHAEENALIEAGRDRVGKRATLYCNTSPCLTCSVKIVQSGITEVVFSQAYSMDDQTARIFQEAGVSLRQYIAPASGLVTSFSECSSSNASDG